MFTPSISLRVVLALSLLCSICIATSFDNQAAAAEFPPVVENFPLPESFSLCGEPFPLEDRHVREMLDREFTISVWDRAQVFMWLKRAGKFFPLIESELARSGLPNDLKYLAVAESSLLPHIRSSAGAMGLWQFMPGTGRKYGLKKDYGLDERCEFEKATAAAIEYLTALYGQFGSWSLALGAYNCGEKCVENAIEEQKVDSYFRLELPWETERFVYRIAAIKLILENPERYGYRIDPSHVYPPVEADVQSIRLSHSIRFIDLAEKLDADYKMLKELNPHITGKHLPPGQYNLKVPPGKGSQIASLLNRLSSASAKNQPHGGHYVVQRGDNLSKIAQATGVDVVKIRRINSIRGDIIHVGQRLRLQ